MEVGERDPVSGQLTTGHECNGITELYTPVPSIVFFFLFLTTLFAIGYWILMPAWPLGWTYTKGVLGIDQKTVVAEQLQAAGAEQSAWMSRIDSMDYAAIQADPGLMKIVHEAGATLFGDNCAACHGTGGTGGKGFPDLTAGAWLWGGEPETIAETLRVGINTPHDETRVSQMLAFGKDGILDRAKISDAVSYVQSLGASAEPGDAEAITRGSEVFAGNCAACHGEDAKGKRDVGAPNLTDTAWIYGGDRQSITSTVYSGHQGLMPTWEQRLTVTQRKILTLYVLALSGQKQ